MASRSFDQFGVLGLYTETSLHCGAENGTGYVDLPVQRERHTYYPVIQGSTLKGVLRDEVAGLDGIDVKTLFGSEDAKTPGTVSFGDGILAAFPIRSSGAPFHWVSCPFVLERVLRLLGAKHPGIPAPAEHQAWALETGEVLLEEMLIRKITRPDLFGPAPESISSRLLSLLPGDARGFAYTRSLLPSRLLIVRDEDFKELVEVGTEVVTRIKLNIWGTTTTISEKEAPELSKFEREGNLFVEELVPPETLFLCALRAAAEPAALTKAFGTRGLIRLGGDETIGRGVTHLTYVQCARQGG